MKLTKEELRELASLFNQDGTELRLILPMADATDQMLDAMNKMDDLKQQAMDFAQNMADQGDHGDAGDQGDAGDAGGEFHGTMSARGDYSDELVLSLRELLRRRAALFERARKGSRDVGAKRP